MPVFILPCFDRSFGRAIYEYVYYSVQKCKERLVFMLMLKRSFHFRTAWYVIVRGMKGTGVARSCGGNMAERR